MMMLVLHDSKNTGVIRVLFLGQLMNVTLFGINTRCHWLLIKFLTKYHTFFTCNLYDEIAMHHCILQPEKGVEAGTRCVFSVKLMLIKSSEQ